MTSNVIKEITKFLKSENDIFYIENDNAVYVCINGTLTCFTTTKKDIKVHGNAEVYYINDLPDFINLYRRLSYGNSK